MKYFLKLFIVDEMFSHKTKMQKKLKRKSNLFKFLTYFLRF